MNWEAYLNTASNFFSVLESIAVIGSLIYLIKQIRDNTTAIKGSTYQSIVTAYCDFEAKLLENDEIARLFRIAHNDPQTVGDDDKEKIIHLMSVYFNLYENLFYQNKKGLLDNSLWEGWRKSLMYEVYGDPGIKFWWERTSSYYSKDFQIFVNSGTYSIS